MLWIRNWPDLPVFRPSVCIPSIFRIRVANILGNILPCILVLCHGRSDLGFEHRWWHACYPGRFVNIRELRFRFVVLDTRLLLLFQLVTWKKKKWIVHKRCFLTCLLAVRLSIIFKSSVLFLVLFLAPKITPSMCGSERILESQQQCTQVHTPARLISMVQFSKSALY